MSEPEKSDSPRDNTENSETGSAVENVITDIFEADPQAERVGLRRGIYLLPNLITTGAMFCGFYAIIAAMSGRLEPAAIAIVMAGFLDGLDGRIARMTNTQSEFGVQYDSLSDLVAFGVAPAVLMFSWVLSELAKVGWTIAFIYMACAALRLARFNTQPDNKVFTGLASPAAAGTLATAVWFWSDNFDGRVGIEMALPIAVVTTALALLMVSGVRYYSPKQLGGRVSFVGLLAIMLLFALVATYPPGALFTIGVVYALSGPIQAIIRRQKRAKNTGNPS